MPEPSAAPSEQASSGPPQLAWDGGAPFDGLPAAILADGERWVIGGWGNPRGPAAWTSTDLTTWQPAVVPDPQPNREQFRGAGLGPMIRLGDSLLSYGTSIGFGDGRGVLGWRSADGTSWESIESSSPLFTRGYYLRDIVVGEPALVAVESGFGAMTGRIWRWTEDASWVDVTPRTDQATDFSTGVITNRVTWGHDRFVVVGYAGDPATDEGSGMSWISADGETWEAAPAQDVLVDTELTAVVPRASGGYLALGLARREDGPRPLIALTSPDGLTWSPVDAPDQGGSQRDSLLVVDGGFVALVDAYEDGAYSVRAWTSEDGDGWTDAGRLDGEPLAAGTDGSTVLVATADNSAEPSVVTLYRGSIDP